MPAAPPPEPPSPRPSPPDPLPLAPITLGLDSAFGYSGDDLTNVRAAALRGEVPFLQLGDLSRPRRALELRVHGVGGAPPSDNLEVPDTLQVAGDSTAGFYRPWFPGSRPNPADGRREAYCWGKLNYRSATRALWLLLIAFLILNVAHFALPRVGAEPASRACHAVCRALLRLIALAITLAFIGTSITVLVDLAAWQAPQRGGLPSWLRTFGELGTGPRMAIALLTVLAVLGGMAWLSRSTAESYEAWDAGTFSTEDSRWPLTSPNFWRGERTVSRQRRCHVLAAAGEVLFIAAMPHSSSYGLRVLAVVVAGLFVLIAAVLTASSWTDRPHAAGRAAWWADTALGWSAGGAVVLAAGASAARFWWQPRDRAHALPGSQPLQTCLVFVIFGLVALLALFLVLLQPWRQKDVMGKGWTAVLMATLGSAIAVIFGAAFTLSIANLLGTPRAGYCGPTGCSDEVLYLPSTVIAGGLGVIALLVLAAGFAAYALGIHRTRLVRRFTAASGPDTVAAHYPHPGGRRAVRAVASTWADSALTDLAAVALAVLAVPTAAVVLAYQWWLALSNRPGAHWLQTLSSLGGTVGVFAVGYFLVQLRSALTGAQARKRFGFVWDVGTFFPRACAPFGPPCYAERSVPEIVTRIRRIVGDLARDEKDPAAAMDEADAVASRPDDPREAHSPVLLVGYSQGTPISVAVLAQLPADLADRVALLTLAAPVRRLYGRAFPAYFGREELDVLVERLSGPDDVRWCNLVRRSDYIGGWVLSPPGDPAAKPPVDVEIYDPPVLWADANPSPPPTHLHSDWFPDPQTRPYAEALLARISI